MSRLLKIIIMPLLLVAILAGLPFSGCGGQTAEEMTEQELQQIAADTLLVTAAVDTYTLNVDITSETLVDGVSLSGAIPMNIEATFDRPQEQMKMSLEIEDVSMDLYMFTDYIYVKAESPEMTGEWMKTPVTNEILDAFNVNLLQDEMKAMESPESLQFLRYEDFDGSECYVIEFTPNDTYLREYASQQQTTDLEIYWDKITDISDIYKKLEYIVWIAKDTKLIKRIDISAFMELSDELAHSSGFEFDTYAADVIGVMKIYDYNEPVSITLPEEAENAAEM